MRRPKQNRILGMTYMQIGILAGLGSLIFGIIGCFVILVLFTESAKTFRAKYLSYNCNSHIYSHYYIENVKHQRTNTLIR